MGALIFVSATTEAISAGGVADGVDRRVTDPAATRDKTCTQREHHSQPF